MATLTHTAYVSRTIIKYGGTGVVVFTLFYIGITWAVKAWIAAHPPYTPPNVRYGVLSKIKFPEKKFEKKNFTLELPNDTVPTFKDQSRVYFIARPDTEFLALEQDKKTAKGLGFINEPTQLAYGIYEFNNNDLNLKLTMNVLDGSFRLKYPYENDQLLLNPKKVPTKEQAVIDAKAYLQRVEKFPQDLIDGTNKVSYWKIEYNGLKAVTSQSEANVARVDFFRKNLEGDFKIVNADVNNATASVIVSGSDVQGKQVIEVNYHYSPIDRESFGTYPIKTAEAAIADLKAGNYWPALDTVGKDNIIRKMYLAYFEPVDLTNYMQPVFVFEGDNNFVAYVSAVTDKYLR